MKKGVRNEKKKKHTQSRSPTPSPPELPRVSFPRRWEPLPSILPTPTPTAPYFIPDNAITQLIMVSFRTWTEWGYDDWLMLCDCFDFLGMSLVVQPGTGVIFTDQFVPWCLSCYGVCFLVLRYHHISLLLTRRHRLSPHYTLTTLHDYVHIYFFGGHQTLPCTSLHNILFATTPISRTSLRNFLSDATLSRTHRSTISSLPPRYM